MAPSKLRTWAYRLAAALGVVYVVYVLALKASQRVTGGPLGELGEFLLALSAVVAFAVGLFADEASRASVHGGPPFQDPNPQEETP